MVSLVDYLITVLLATFYQLLILFGPLLLIAFIMNLISGWTERVSCELLGKKLYLFLFGWLGTFFHELGHALFAFLFNHKITEVKFFSFNPEGNTLGYVNHSYNPKSVYQRVGNFFIGIGPIILCLLVLFSFSYLLISVNVFESVSDLNVSVESFSSVDAVLNLGSNVFSVFNNLILLIQDSSIPLWRLFLFFYVVFSVGSSVKLSSSDVKGAISGFLFFTFLLLVFNLLTLWFADFITGIIILIGSSLSILNSLMLISLLLNGFMLIIFTIFNQLKRVIIQ